MLAKLQLYVKQGQSSFAIAISKKGKKKRGAGAKLTKEGIIQRDLINTPHIQIAQQVGVEVEEDGHVDGLAGVEALLLEAEALDLAEIGGHLGRGDAVRGHADNVRVAAVRRRVEGQRRLARQHAHLALLRHEFPRQHVRYRRVERYADAPRVSNRHEP